MYTKPLRHDSFTSCFRVDSVDSDCTLHYGCVPWRGVYVCKSKFKNPHPQSAQLRTLRLCKNPFSGVHESGRDLFKVKINVSLLSITSRHTKESIGRFPLSHGETYSAQAQQIRQDMSYCYVPAQCTKHKGEATQNL